MLMRSIIQQYHGRGYTILPYKLHPTILNELNSAFNELHIEAEKEKNIKYTQQYDLDKNGNLCKIKRPHQWHNAFKSLLYNPFITKMVSNLLNDPSTSSSKRPIDLKNCGIRYQGFKLNIKPPFDGMSTILHQDFAYYPHTNDHLCAVCIPLIDMTLNNGTLIYIPETHLGPIYSHHLNDEFIGGIYDLEEEKNINDYNIEAIECSAGSIIIHHSRIIHGSMVNKSDKYRALLILQYAANDSWPLSQFVKGSWGYDLPNNHKLDEWDIYQSTIITGKPTYYPFMDQIPIHLPLPWPQRANFGSVYNQQKKVIDNKKNDLIQQIDDNKIKINRINHNEEDLYISPCLLPKVSSNKQINTIYNFNDDDLWKRLVDFISIGPFGLLEDTKYNDLRLNLQNVFVAACDNLKDDDNMIYKTLYQYFHDNIMRDYRFKDKLTQFNHYNNNRVSIRSNEIINILTSMDRLYISNMLDIGCGDGLITMDIGKRLNLSNINIHGCDIKKYDNIHKDMVFNMDIYNNYMDQYFDLIICLMSVHHIKKQKELFDEILRILKPNGILIIREHDCYIPEINVLLDIVHGFHSRVWSKIGHQNYRLNFFDDFESYYQSYNQWNMTLTSCGFKKHSLSPIYSQKHRDVKNVFFAIYTK